MLLEKQRVGRRSNQFEHNFPVFIRLLAGADDKLRHDLHLDNKLLEENPFLGDASVGNVDEMHKQAIEFKKLMDSFTELGFDRDSTQAIWNMVAAIVHLGHAGLTTGKCKALFTLCEHEQKCFDSFWVLIHMSYTLTQKNIRESLQYFRFKIYRMNNIQTLRPRNKNMFHSL